MHSIAAVFHSSELPLTLEHFPLPNLDHGEALVRIRCATICGSDLHTILGRRKEPTPSILGHEMVGDLIAANHAKDYYGNSLELGTRIAWSILWSCTECYFCRHGLPSRCERLYKFGHQALNSQHHSQHHFQHQLSGAFAEHCHLPSGTAIFGVPDNIPDEVAASANCATATVAAVIRHAGPLAGQNVLIMGAGMLGLTACAMASTAGAASVVALDPDERRLKLAAQFGATFTTMDPKPSHGFDIALEFAGTPQACEQALAALRPGGHLLLAGSVFPSSPMQLPAELIVRRMLRISGVYNYQPEDLAAALKFLAQTQSCFPFGSLVGQRFPLNEINAAIAFAERERPPRVAITPY